MSPKQFYLRQAELCIRLAEETLDSTLAERLRASAADFFEKADDGGMEDRSILPPDIIVDGGRG